jgi:hypothetical protein
VQGLKARFFRGADQLPLLLYTKRSSLDLCIQTYRQFSRLRDIR